MKLDLSARKFLILTVFVLFAALPFIPAYAAATATPAATATAAPTGSVSPLPSSDVETAEPTEKPFMISASDSLEEQAEAVTKYIEPLIKKEIRELPGVKHVVVTKEMADVLVTRSGLDVNLIINNANYARASVVDGQIVIEILYECTVWDGVIARLTVSRKNAEGKSDRLVNYDITVIGAIIKATDIEMFPEAGTKILLKSQTSKVAGYIKEKNILDPTVTYQSLNPEIATVDKTTGIITPVKPGKFTVKMSGGGISKRLELEIVKSK